MLSDLVVNLSDDPILSRDLEAVVCSAVKEFMTMFPACPPAGARPIHIFHRAEGPITDSTTDPNVYRIGLAVRDRLYSQLVFQLGHELCHVFADPRRSNWFVECCCEMVSLVLLRRTSESWACAPPFSNWINYAPRFKEYAEDRVRKATAAVFGSGSLPDLDQLCKWLASVSYSFRENPVDRQRNLIIAEMIRPFFEESANNWDALRFLGQASIPPPVDLTDLEENSHFQFDRWFQTVPDHLKQLVRAISNVFGDKTPSDSP